MSENFAANSPSSDRRRLLCAWLRGEPLAWRAERDDEAARLLFESRYHGVTALLYQQVQLAAKNIVCPDALRAELKLAAAGATAQELIRRAAVEELLAALAERGVATLLLKGTPLAYMIYPTASLRSRGDTDLLIRRKDLPPAEAVFIELGYQRANGLTGEFVNTQISFSKDDDYGVGHSFDLHWRASNSYPFGETFTFDELAASSSAIPALGAHARGLGAEQALLFACMHRLTHRQAPYYVDGVGYFDSDRLIWLYDIHLLARAMSASQWRRVIEIAVEKGLQQVCLNGLQAAADSLGTDMPEEVRQRLSRYGSEGVTPVACFDLPSWRWELLGLRRARSWRARIKFVAEHLFPARGYVQEKYRCTSRKLLPFYYIRRAVEGICRRF